MPAPTGYQLRWLVAVGGEGRRSLAYEYLVSDSFALELRSDPDPTPPLDYNAHVGATFDIDGTPVSAYVPSDANHTMLTLAWTHEDKEYRLYVMPASLVGGSKTPITLVISGFGRAGRRSDRGESPCLKARVRRPLPPNGGDEI
jgi:hypothetical protein